MSTCNLITGQVASFENDTIDAGNVTVFSSDVKGESGYRKTEINTDRADLYLGSSLSSLLTENSTISIRNYGPGGLSTSSFRGMGASHTNVLWEGIPINSPASGQLDLSQLIAVGYQKIEIYHGAMPGTAGSGGPGGSISLYTSADWKTGTNILMKQEAGSFGSYNSSLSAITGTRTFRLGLNGYYLKSRNDFPYTDYYLSATPVERVRTDNDYFIRGVNTNMSFRALNNILTTNIWYNSAERQLPGPVISSGSSGEKQDDNQFRLMLNLKNYSTPIVFDFSGAYLYDYLFYSNNQAEIESLIESNTIYLSGSGKYLFSENSRINFMVSERIGTVNSSNHKGEKGRSVGKVKAEYSFGEEGRAGIVVMTEMSLSDGKVYGPLPSVGVEMNLLRNAGIFLKGNIGKSVIIPTLNDLYWVPGGNPDLKVEKGLNGELTLEKRKKSGTNGLYAGGEVTYYYSRIRDMIKWLPGDYGIWSPANLADVRSDGAEADAEFGFARSKSDINFSMSYTYTSVTNLEALSENDESLGKQLIYIPYHRANISLNYNMGPLSMRWTGEYTGFRYTTADNSISLPTHFIHNLVLCFTGLTGNNEIKTVLSVRNIFDTYYEQVAFYPMPGRNYNISIIWEINGRK